MSRADELRAELAIAELEEELADLKASGGDPDRLHEVRHELRDARRAFRETREAAAAEEDVE
jgi:uncharacterized membrane protein